MLETGRWLSQWLLSCDPLLGSLAVLLLVGREEAGRLAKALGTGLRNLCSGYYSLHI